MLLYFAFRDIDFSKLADNYRQANSWFIIPFVATMLLELLFRSARWRLLLNPSKPVRLWDAFRLETAGLALSNILPLRLGEIARGTFGGKVFGIPILTVFSTILVERALDVVVLLFMFGGAAYFGGITGGFLKYDHILWTLLTGLGAALGALIFSDEIIAHEWFSGFFAGYPRVRGVFERLAMGVKGFHSFRSGALIFLFAALQWSMDALNCYWIGRAFGLEGTINAGRSVALIFTGAVAASVPGMPGYFGNFEYAIKKVLVSWGVAEDLGLAYASYLHVLGYVLVTLVGVFFVYQMGNSLGKVWGEFSAAGGAGKDPV